MAKQALAQYGIVVGSHILQINDIKEERFNPMGVSDAELAELHTKKFAVMDDAGRRKNAGAQFCRPRVSLTVWAV